MLIVWLTAIGALVVWLGGSRATYVTIGGGPHGSEALELTQSIAKALNKADIGLKVRVYETGGSVENLRLMEAGRIDFGTLQADLPMSDGVLGIATLYRDSYHLIARKESGILSFSDLPGHRIAIPPQSSGQYSSFWFLAEHYGLSRDDLNAQPMAEEAANFAMERGQVDAVFRVRAPGNHAIRELIGDKDVRLVPIEQSEALALKQPAIHPGFIPLGSYRGFPALPVRDLPTASVERLLLARADMDPALAYKFTRAIYDQRSEVLEGSRLAGFIGPLPQDADSVVATHPGARRYYDREKPGFMRQNARLVSTFLYVIAILFSALLALRAHWVKSRRLRMHDFNRRLVDIATAVRDENDTAELVRCKQEMVDILQHIVGDLENERVSQEEFEHFSFTWQAVDALVRDRLLLSGSFAQQAMEVEQ